MATSALFGSRQGGKALPTPFLFAFRIPNLFRQLFGEGASDGQLSPRVDRPLGESIRDAARHLSSVVVTLLAALLTGLAAAGELLLGLIWLIWGDSPQVELLVGLSAVMLPYVVLICVAAQLSTMLYAHRALYSACLGTGNAQRRLADCGLGWIACGFRRNRWRRPMCWRSA